LRFLIEKFPHRFPTFSEKFILTT